MARFRIVQTVTTTYYYDVEAPSKEEAKIIWLMDQEGDGQINVVDDSVGCEDDVEVYGPLEE